MSKAFVSAQDCSYCQCLSLPCVCEGNYSHGVLLLLHCSAPPGARWLDPEPSPSSSVPLKTFNTHWTTSRREITEVFLPPHPPPLSLRDPLLFLKGRLFLTQHIRFCFLLVFCTCECVCVWFVWMSCVCERTLTGKASNIRNVCCNMQSGP